MANSGHITGAWIDTYATKTAHKKGKIAEGKIQRSWRINVGVDNNLHEEARRLGFSSVPAFINAHFTRYFNGEIIMRGQ